ncbi:hypothetical protein MUU45_000756 [Rodentibacter pneumotropicus]|uniref:Phage MuF C-terminal domain-containing protein n=1 Tax=Rodentibacter pneumotropicus TaxID=758 RepID=A0AAW5LBL0_9PAST|nr:LPD38 domain-containing protein [Rodentibacter pneumotropicus]MCQ9120938.1 hypothetical protein [Rodentibacter pneumotropicus]
MSQNNTSDYFDSIVGLNSQPTKQGGDYFDTVLSTVKNTRQDVTGMGQKYADQFNQQVDGFTQASPVQKFQAFEKYGSQLKDHLLSQGYTGEQIAKVFGEFSTNADPRNKTSAFDYYVGDRGNEVMIGTGNLVGDALAAVPESIPVLGQWADNAEKYVKDVTKAWKDDLSDENQINSYLGEKEYQSKLANGADEFTATWHSIKENPMQVTSLITEQTPQLILGGLGKLGLGAVNIAGAAGRSRNNVEEAYDKTFKENPEQLLKLPEIQERMVQGMTFEQAVNDAKLDISDNWKTILAGAAIGATEMFTPLGKIGQGINRGVLKTLGKEVGQEALQEGAEQLNSNLAAGEIDGKTKAFDDVIRNATLGAIGGLGTGIPTAIEAGLNRNNLTEQQSSDKTIDDLANSTSSESQPTQPKSPVNGNVLEKILADHQLDQASRDELYRELKSDIEDGRLQQRLNESDREYADLARAYLEQTGQMPPADFTADSQGNVQNNGVQAEQSAVENEQVFADAELQAIEPEQETTQPVFDEDRLEQYRQASQDIVSAYQRGDITEGEVNSRYADIIQRYPEHQQLAQELYRRQQEDQEQQVLYSRSPMKSVEANIKRGQERMTQAILDKADVKRGMYNGEFGWVDFVWGDDGKTKLLNERGEPRGRGIAHIFEARERKDKVDYQSTAKMLVNNIVETIAKGSIATQTPKRLVLDYKGQNEPNGHRVILTKQKGSNAWILSGYEKFPVGGNSQLHDKTIPTQTLPTRSRQDLGATGADNVQQSTQQRNDQIQQDQQTLSRLLGEETASHIQVVDRNTEIPSGKDVKKLVSDGVEGWFEISTQKLYLISDNITADETLSRDERLAWVAWHELAHSGVRVKYGDVLTRILAGASENTVVKVIARKIQQDRGDISYPVAVEEALVEIYAAYETGNWAALENRYKTKIHESYKQGKNSVADHLTQIANYIRKLMNLIFRNPKFTEKMTTSDVFNTLSGIKEGINTLTDSQQEQTAQGDVRYSLNENADSDFAKAVNDVANGNAVNQYVQVGTTPNVLKMLGLPDVRVTISGQVLHKVMQGKHNVTAETLKQLPKQINNPVAVMRSATQDNSYVVLTELVEDDNGKDKPVIAALHLKKSSQGLELISIASVYGRSNAQIQRGLDNDLLYWNKAKGSQFLTAFGLQLPSHMQSNTNLSTDNIKTETDLSQYQSENAEDIEASSESDIRYSRKPSVLEQIESGEIHRSEDETTLHSLLSEKEFSKAWEYFKVKADTALADQTRPVAEWLKNLEQSGLITHAEQVSIVHQMNSTDGVKNAANARMMQKYLQPLIKNINALAKKHNMSVEQAKFYAEYWLSARYSVEKNNEYLANEKQKIEEALQAIEEAKNAGDENAIAQATRDHRRAERQYRYRKADVESQVWGRDKQGNQLYQPKVGTAGGWSIPHAQTIMRNIEAKIPAKEIEIATKPLFEAIEENLAMNLASGRITREQYHKYRQNKHYVPLTGDNEIDLEKENDYIGGAGRKAKNVSKDKAAKGRSNSEAEGAIDATWRMLDKTITNAAWQPFKNSIDELYETAKENALKEGHSEREAQKLAEEATGITKQLMKGTTRTSDDVLIRKYGDNYYEYKLPDNVMRALNSSQTVSPLGDLWGFRQIKTLTGWFARGVTQLKPMFALKNMVRDSWEKSILLTTREILGSNGKDLDQKAKNKIGRDMTKLVWGAHLGRNGIYKATAKFAKEGGTANLDDRKDAQGNYLNKEQGYLKEMIDSGALSTYSTMLARTRKDLDKEFKQYGNPTLAAKAMRLAEMWNTTFDTVSSLASYMALRENGISPAQSSGLVLGLMDFRKQGSFTKHFKGFYAFLNPAIQGGKNNLMFIRTRRGQVYLASRVLMGMMVYQLLSALAGDDDEAGGKMDSKGDLSREIRIPTPLGDIRIPVGYGAPQMAWNMAVNMMRYFNGQIHLSDAVGNIVAHNAKSLMPVSPNETSVTKDPFAKIANTLTPTIFKPFVELATDRNAFGNKITPNWVNEKELHATQSKSNTAKFWEDVAKTMYDVFGMDAHPESYQHLINAYKGFLGSAGDLATALIENPNRVAQGKPMSIPLFNDFFALKGESRVGTLYYESKAEMENLAKAYKYEQEHHPENVKTWLTPERKRLLALNEEANKAIGVVRKVKANATKGLEKKQISQAEYDKRLALYYKKVDEVQRRILFKYRTLEKLNTKKTH